MLDYVPILKWKQGERIALRNLVSAQWDKTVPLIELLPINAPPEVPALREALKSYMPAIAKELKKYPDGQSIIIDTRYVSLLYRSQLNLLKVICQYLDRNTECKIIPALGETIIGDGSTSLRPMAEFDELVVRININAVSPDQVEPLIQCVIDHTEGASQIHTVIDQGALVGANASARVSTVTPYLDAALAAPSQTVTLAGGSFPVNLIGKKQGVHDFPRVEWMIWKAFRAKPAYRKVHYADYAVSHPDLQEELDPTKVNPSVAIRYCTTDKWRLYKAGGFKLGTPNQYNSLATLLLADTCYSGKTFSWGDNQYDLAASGLTGGGNPSSWRRDATNHHIALVASTV